MSAPQDHRSELKLDCDVLVVGGGAAGVAAAVVASRRGARVVLVERYGFCGGGAVAGLSGTICGMYAATNDVKAPPRQVVHGFLDEFVAAMERHGGLAAPVRYGKTFTRVHDPLVWREVADGLLTEAGVQVLFHTTVFGAPSRVEKKSKASSPTPKRDARRSRPRLPSTQAATLTSSRWPASHPSSGNTGECKIRR